MKHKIEVFSAGCKTCKDTIETVRKMAGPEHEVLVHDMHKEEIASRAAQHGVRSVPAVVINGKLAGCCAPPTIVTYLLEQIEGGTRVQLRHSGFSSAALCTANRVGWETSLQRLMNLLALPSIHSRKESFS